MPGCPGYIRVSHATGRFITVDIALVRDKTVMFRNKEDVLSWKDYFMSLAFLSGQRSKDKRTQVGACIVNDRNRIVGLGYNGMPDRCDDKDMPWNRQEEGTKLEDSKKPYVVHAELNAILNSNGVDLRDHHIYVALFPCCHCSQAVVQSGISKVVYYSDKYHDKGEFKAGRLILEKAGVEIEKYTPERSTVTIDFASINNTEKTKTDPKDLEMSL